MPATPVVDLKWTRTAWGAKQRVASHQGCIVDRIRIDAHCKSSQHRHLLHGNLFVVELGTLLVHFFGDLEAPLEQPETRAVDKGQSLYVPPGIWHQFQTTVPCAVLEVYSLHDAEPCSVEADIERIPGTRVPES